MSHKFIPLEDVIGPVIEYHVDPQDKQLVLIESTKHTVLMKKKRRKSKGKRKWSY